MMNKIGNILQEVYDKHSISGVIAVVVLSLFFAFGILSIKAWAVMFLWNWVMVDLFALPVLNFWYSFGLTILFSLLFKSKGFSNSKE